MFHETRRERLKSAPYLRLKKRKTFFWKKFEIFETIFSFKKSHSAEKCKRGDPSGFINIHSVAKYQKKIRKKVAQCRKKSKGGPLGTSGFVGFLEKVKNERATLWTRFALAGHGLRWFGFRIVSKKWTGQCEDCSLKKTRERLKSAPYLRLKKRKTFFWKKTCNFWKNFLSKKVA